MGPYLALENTTISDCEQVCDQFAELFGDDLIEYYYDEKYLLDKDRAVYDDLVRKFMSRLKV